LEDQIKKKITCLVDQGPAKKEAEEQDFEVSLSYIPQSRAIYKIIYVHPPEARFVFSKSDFDDFDKLDDYLLGTRTVIMSTRWPLQKMLSWHQDLHFGRDLLNKNIQSYLGEENLKAHLMIHK
jgi:hypothetical protein